MHSVWSSTKLTDCGEKFQFSESESLFLLQIYLALTLFQLIFLKYSKQLEVKCPLPWIRNETRNRLEIWQRDKSYNLLLKSDKHAWNIVPNARIFFVWGIFWRPGINFWRHNVSFERCESKDITERYNWWKYLANISCGYH